MADRKRTTVADLLSPNDLAALKRRLFRTRPAREPAWLCPRRTAIYGRNMPHSAEWERGRHCVACGSALDEQGNTARKAEHIDGTVR